MTPAIAGVVENIRIVALRKIIHHLTQSWGWLDL